MKKLVKLVTETKVDNETGEVKEIVTTEHTRFASEPGYVKLYLQDIAYLTKLPKGSEGILYGVLRHVNYNHQVVLNKYIKEQIAADAGVTLKTVNNNITTFTKYGVLIRVATGVYEINTFLFGKGHWKDILKHRKGLKLEIEYNAESDRVVKFLAQGDR